METKLHDYYTITLDRFINIYCDRDLSQLVISGEATEEELLLAWEGIMLEYNDILKGEAQMENEWAARVITLYSMKIEAIQLILFRLSIEFDNEIWDELSGYTDFGIERFNPQDPQQYAEALQHCFSAIRMLESDIEDLKKEVDQAVESSPKAIIDKKYFAKLIVLLSRESSFQINRSTMLLCEFTEMLLNLLYKVEQKQYSSQPQN